ncbi:bifunctional diguanylate cyclase/phosphodiesterase [Pseudoxanthomonas sp.]|jgi:diguanylate cyclase (GGDEF)-like protein|uniref:putative bifunctional diguanylate cyclase/phosphodiesterase n=1 Tax=Pseudoxanthomonas sp. TaxID=1871049 RepID=UPI002E0DA0C7|nr:bifunctional diguanylate cyclase/phosphodiesterase [Pseudoxanthomonas sp.]
MIATQILSSLQVVMHTVGSVVTDSSVHGWILLLPVLALWQRHLAAAVAPQISLQTKAPAAPVADNPMYDALTGLPGQLQLEQRLRAVPGARPEGLLVLGADGFRAINQLRGHEFGNKLLMLIAARIRAQVGTGAFLARLPGDEFAVLAPFEDAVQLKTMARRLLRCMEPSFVIQGTTVDLTVSIGIAVDNAKCDHRRRLLANASQALAEAKESGRNRFCLFNAALSGNAAEIELMIGDLRKALSEQQMYLAYQPKQDLQSGVVVGVEALLRWDHPTLGAIAPDYFISVAEKTGMIVEVGRWVIDEACRQMRSWRDELGVNCKVAVNASVFQINSTSFVFDVATALERHGLDPSCLCIEVTESNAMTQAQSSMMVLRQLADSGVCIALDDFGVGHSSLAHLKRMPIQELKIDRSFVDGIVDCEEDAAIVRAIITLGKAMGLYVVAEGVETHAQQALLAQMECDAVQGYLIGRPASAAALGPTLAAARSAADSLQRFLEA